MSLFAPTFDSPVRPIGVLIAGTSGAATELMLSAFAEGQHPRLWLCTGSGRAEVVALLDSIHFDLVVCDGAADTASADLVTAVRLSPYGNSLLLAAGPLAFGTNERLDVAVHRRFGLDVPAPRPARPHQIDTRSALRRPA